MAPVRLAEAVMPSVRVPGLSMTKTTSKVTEPSGTTRLTIFTCSTVAG